MTLPDDTSVLRPKSQGYDVQIDNFYFRLGSSPDNPMVEGVRQIPKRGPDSAVAGQGGGFKVTQERFGGGEGHKVANDIDSSRFDATRFWDSNDVVVDTSKKSGSSVKVARARTLLHTGGTNYNSPDQAPMMVYADSSLFFVDNDQQTINRIDSPLTSSIINTENPHDGEVASNIWGLAQEGGDVYAILFNGHIHKRDASTDTWSHWLDFQTKTGGKPHAIFAAKGRLFVGHDGELYEVTTDGVTTLLATASNPGSGTSWTSVVDGGHAILAGNRNGNVYAFSGGEGELSLKQQTSFEGEEISGVGASKGVVLVGTRYASPTGDVNRVYEASLGGDYTLRGVRTQGIQLLREWDNGDDELNEAPAFFIGSRDSIYFGVEEDLFHTGSPNTLVWRYDIGTSGLFREWATGSLFGTRGIATVENRVFHLNQEGYLYRQSTDFKGDQGYLITPFLKWGTDQLKNISKITVEASTLDETGGSGNPFGSSLKVYYSSNPDALLDLNHSSWTFIEELFVSANRSHFTINPHDSTDWPAMMRHGIALKFEFEASDDSLVTPVLYGYSVESESPHIFQLPVLASDRIERPGRKPIRVDGLGNEIIEFLRERRGKTLHISIIDEKPWRTFNGTISQIEVRRVGDEARGGGSTVAMVTFEGVWDE